MSKRILIAPLDWGLGHATRCIPLIKYLIEKGHEPIIAASGRPLNLLKSEFPSVETVAFEGYNISYPEGSGMVWKMFKSTPRILKRIKAERVELDALIDELKLDAVISDNRFGLYSSRIPSVYITHQVMIKAPFFESILYRLHANYMQKFAHVWVPDFEIDGLSGDLGHKFPLPANARFIGPLSRFEPSTSDNSSDLLIVISGPEPQRTRFEKIVLKQLESFEGTAIAVLGTPGQQIDRKDDLGHRIVSHLSADQLGAEMMQANLVVSRSGYSTIMDLSALGKKAAFVPTPGQTEQEYLAKKFDAKGQHMMMRQSKFDLKTCWDRREEYSGFTPRTADKYKTAIDRLIAAISGV